MHAVRPSKAGPLMRLRYTLLSTALMSKTPTIYHV